MRVTMETMDLNHQQIVDSAARLLRERGLGGTSVADLMAAAGMTHGGFYRHFASKEALAIEALQACFAQQLARVEPLQVAGDTVKTMAAFKRLYLGKDHVENPGLGCPLPALGADVARSGEALQAVYGEGFNSLVEQFSTLADGEAATIRDDVIREYAMMIGAVLLSRACEPKTAQRVLRACRK